MARARAAVAERERLTSRRLDAPDAERRRIAADLHDGVVQDLAGVGFTLAALADRAESDEHDDAQARRLTATAGNGSAAASAPAPRCWWRSTRPTRPTPGLDTALEDLVASTNGWTGRRSTSIPTPSSPDQTRRPWYRAARESLQNVRKTPGRVDGAHRPHRRGRRQRAHGRRRRRGFAPPSARTARRLAGKAAVGLRLMADLAVRAAVASPSPAPGEGTTVRLEVP